jgi:hypothetical protein
VRGTELWVFSRKNPRVLKQQWASQSAHDGCSYVFRIPDFLVFSINFILAGPEWSCKTWKSEVFTCDRPPPRQRLTAAVAARTGSVGRLQESHAFSLNRTSDIILLKMKCVHQKLDRLAIRLSIVKAVLNVASSFLRRVFCKSIFTLNCTSFTTRLFLY